MRNDSEDDLDNVFQEQVRITLLLNGNKKNKDVDKKMIIDCWNALWTINVTGKGRIAARCYDVFWKGVSPHLTQSESTRTVIFPLRNLISLFSGQTRMSVKKSLRMKDNIGEGNGA